MPLQNRPIKPEQVHASLMKLPTTQTGRLRLIWLGISLQLLMRISYSYEFSSLINTEPTQQPRKKSSPMYDEQQVLNRCECISVFQLYEYSSWIEHVGILTTVGAPLELWDTLRQQGNTHNINDCCNRWLKFKPNNYTMGSLAYLAKACDIKIHSIVFKHTHYIK